MRRDNSGGFFDSSGVYPICPLHVNFIDAQISHRNVFIYIKIGIIMNEIPAQIKIYEISWETEVDILKQFNRWNSKYNFVS